VVVTVEVVAMTDEEELSLISGGDSNLHSHAFDRAITHDQVLQYQDNEGVRQVSLSYSVTYGDDFIFVDSTSGLIRLQFPIARGGKSYTVVMVAGANSVLLIPSTPDSINGSSSLTISATYSPVRIKALKGVGWIQV